VLVVAIGALAASGAPAHAGPPAEAPAITNFAQSAQTWRLGSRLPAISRAGKPVGTTFRFDLNVAASTLFAFTRIEAGRTVGGKCVRPTTANRGKRRCTRFIPAGRLTVKGHAGTNTVRFQGRITKTRHLKAGRHQLTIFATDSQGQNSFPNTLRFTVLNP
jgi:hypothetical protein